MKKIYLLAVFCFMASICSAYDFTAVSPSGHTLYYSINGSEVTLSSEVVCNASSLKSYETPPVGNVVIPESVTHEGKTYRVTAIGDHAFWGCRDVTSITIPESVDSIAVYAFTRTGITSIVIP